jgi:chromatin remodeling complex protein RSC6
MPKKSGTSQKPKQQETMQESVASDPLETSVTLQESAKPVKQQKKTSTKKTTPVQPVQSVDEVQPAVVETVLESAVVGQESSAETAQLTGVEIVNNMLSEFSTTLHSLNTQLNTLRNEFKSLSKTVNREMKTYSKSCRRKRTGGNKQPSGFVKPTLITNELASFLGREHGSEMARTEVTKEINQYIRSHNLQDTSNGRHINPDKKLSKLLNYNGEETLTYFNLQKYLSPHFVKQTEVVA